MWLSHRDDDDNDDWQHKLKSSVAYMDYTDFDYVMANRGDIDVVVLWKRWKHIKLCSWCADHGCDTMQWPTTNGKKTSEDNDIFFFSSMWLRNWVIFWANKMMRHFSPFLWVNDLGISSSHQLTWEFLPSSSTVNAELPICIYKWYWFTTANLT